MKRTLGIAAALASERRAVALAAVAEERVVCVGSARQLDSADRGGVRGNKRAFDEPRMQRRCAICAQ